MCLAELLWQKSFLTIEYFDMRISKAWLGLLLFSTACTPKQEAVEDSHQHIQLLWRNSDLNWITSSLLIKDSLLYFGSFNKTFCTAQLTTGNLNRAFKTGGDLYYPPLIAGNRIYFSSFDLTVYCLDAAGKLVWKRKTAARVKNKLLAQDSLLYIPVRDDGIWAVKARDGAAVWHLPQPAVSLSTTQPILRANKLYVGRWGLSDSLVAIDSKTGKIEWATSYSGYASSDPVATAQGLVVSTDKYYQGGKVKLLQYATGQELWSTNLKCEALFPPLVQDQQLIVATYNEQVVCLSTSTGQVQWITTLAPGEEVATQFCRFRHGLYFGTTARNLYCLANETGKLLFKEPFEYGLSDLLVANDKLYIPTGGSELWSLKE
jgi:outer membrane protein assembly factor BamB